MNARIGWNKMEASTFSSMASLQECQRSGMMKPHKIYHHAEMKDSISKFIHNGNINNNKTHAAMHKFFIANHTINYTLVLTSSKSKLPYILP